MNSKTKVSYADYTSFVSDLLPNLLADLSRFTAFSPKFSQTYLEDIQEKYNQVITSKSDNVFIDEQAKAHDEIEILMDKARNIFQRVKVFVEMAFPGDRNTWNQFGFNDYEEARRDSDKMSIFLTDLHIVCVKYGNELVENGFSLENIGEVKSLGDELRQSKRDYKTSKVERSRASEQRSLLLSDIHELLSPMFKAARFIWPDDVQREAIYKFPAPRPKNKDEEANSETTNETENTSETN